MGGGLTSALDRKENAQGLFFDTPGLADDEYRQAAAEAIQTALREGGPYKLLFFISQLMGRCVKQDLSTMKLVLDAVPEVKNNYGIVINQVPDNIATKFQEVSGFNKFLTKLFFGIDDDRRCAASNIMIVNQVHKLTGVDNALVDSKDLVDAGGNTFHDFVYGKVPVVRLTKDKAGDIAWDEFEKMTELLEEKTKELEKDKQRFEQEQAKLKEQLKQAEEDKELDRIKEQRRFEMEMKRLDAEIELKAKENKNKSKERIAEMQAEKDKALRLKEMEIESQKIKAEVNRQDDLKRQNEYDRQSRERIAAMQAKTDQARLEQERELKEKELKNERAVKELAIKEKNKGFFKRHFDFLE